MTTDKLLRTGSGKAFRELRTSSSFRTSDFGTSNDLWTSSQLRTSRLRETRTRLSTSDLRTTSTFRSSRFEERSDLATRSFRRRNDLNMGSKLWMSSLQLRTSRSRKRRARLSPSSLRPTSDFRASILRETGDFGPSSQLRTNSSRGTRTRLSNSSFRPTSDYRTSSFRQSGQLRTSRRTKRRTPLWTSDLRTSSDFRTTRWSEKRARLRPRSSQNESWVFTNRSRTTRPIRSTRRTKPFSRPTNPLSTSVSSTSEATDTLPSSNFPSTTSPPARLRWVFATSRLRLGFLDTLTKRSTCALSDCLVLPAPTYSPSQKLIEALGIPYVQPSPSDPHEAEGICATLVSLGLADYVVSEDTDVTVYGAPLLRQITTCRDVSGQEDIEDPSVEESSTNSRMNVLDPARLREELGLDRETFVDLALLLGTDFAERIPRYVLLTASHLSLFLLTISCRVGYATALKLVRCVASILSHNPSSPVL